MASMIQKSRDGRIVRCAQGQERLLACLYGSVWGRLLLKPLTSPLVSRMAGCLLSTRLSCILISPFVRCNHIDLSQFQPCRYHSYNDFFSRRIRPECRPVDLNPSHLIAPCDSKLTVLPISPQLHFSLKHTRYTLSSLLQSDKLAQAYSGGYLLIFRLTVDDYHRYCYIADGEKGKNTRIPGVLHTVNPIANDYFPIFKENSREYSVLHSPKLGDVLMMEVGALMVGKIVNHHDQAAVRRGEEKGYFQFGGSTVILAFQPDQVRIDDDILANSQQGAETLVKYGEKIGTVL